MKKLMLWVAFTGIAASSGFAQTPAAVTSPEKSKQEVAPKPATKPNAEMTKSTTAPKATHPSAPASQPSAMTTGKPASKDKSGKSNKSSHETKAPQTQPPAVK